MRRHQQCMRSTHQPRMHRTSHQQCMRNSAGMGAHSSVHECMRTSAIYCWFPCKGVRSSAAVALCWWRTLEEFRIAANAFAPCLGRATCPHSTQCPHSRLNVIRHPRARSQRCVDHSFTLLRCSSTPTLARSRCLLLPLSLLSRLTFLLCVGSRNAFACSTDVGFYVTCITCESWQVRRPAHHLCSLTTMVSHDLQRQAALKQLTGWHPRHAFSRSS
jgi:hypothetical protein